MSPQATNATPHRQWERVTLDRPLDKRFRETLRPNAPSPREEILSRHDEELNEQATGEEAEVPAPGRQARDGIVCF